MGYDVNNFQSQLQNLMRQYQQLQQTPSTQQLFQQNQIPQLVQIPTPPHQIQYVEGLAGAKLYQENLQPNSSEIILDKDEDLFYKVSKDANGIPSKKIAVCQFSLVELKEEEPAFLTRKDLDDFKEEIKQLISSNNSKQVVLSQKKEATK